MSNLRICDLCLSPPVASDMVGDEFHFFGPKIRVTISINSAFIQQHGHICIHCARKALAPLGLKDYIQ